MIDGQRQHVGDFSMLELFRTELETHVTVLNDGLLALEHTPDARDKLESLMRAAHSIKGSARIVELNDIVQIAHVMEDCFVAVQNRELSLMPEQIDILLKGTDMLREIAEATFEEDNEWFTEHQDDVDALMLAITAILQPDVLTSGTPESSAPQARQPLPENVPSDSAKCPAEQEEPASDFSSENPAVTEAHAETQSDDLPDAALIEFFRSEVEVHTAIIQKGLNALQNGAGDIEKLDALFQAIRAIEGGARIVGVGIASTLAQAIAHFFERLPKEQLTLTERHVELLLQGLRVLRRLSQAAVEGDQPALQECRQDGEQVIVGLADSLKEIPPAMAATATARTEVSSPAAQQGDAEKIPPSRSLPPTTTPSPEVQKSPPVAQRSSVDLSGLKKGNNRARTVRVTAAKIERLMGLAGEVVVSARWLPPFSESLLSLKNTNRELSTILEKLREQTRLRQEKDTVRELVSQAEEIAKGAAIYLVDRLNQLDMFSSTFVTLSDRLYHEVIGIRMRPFSDGIRGFPRMVRDLGRELGKKVRLDIIGKRTEVDRDILEKLDAPLTHLLRNAVDHGLEFPEERLASGKSETGTIRLEAAHRSGMLLITIADDGRGIDLERLRQKIVRKGLANAEMVEHLTETELLKFLFLPGFSTTESVTEISGRGVGLDVVDNMVHDVGGVVRVTSQEGKGVSFYLELPLTLSVIRTFLVDIDGEPYAFPLARIERCLMLSKDDIEVVEDRQYFRFGEDNVALVDIYGVLEMPASKDRDIDKLPIVVISDRANFYGLLVDRFVGECDLVVRPLDPRLGKIPDISAAAVMLDGSPILIFDIEDLVRSVDKMLNKKALHKLGTVAGAQDDEVTVKRILVVDDSITVREMERKLLENKGYLVEVAVDGLEGWNAVRADDFDLVISDVDMPRMNGIELIRHIKEHEELREMPVMIVSYKDSEAHRLQGLEAGADYYLTKSSFHDDSFITAVIDLIGEV